MNEVKIKRLILPTVMVSVKRNDKTWPKDYECTFLEPGVASYEDVGQGVAFLSKETIDNMLPSFIGKPMVLTPSRSHKDMRPESIGNDKAVVGLVTQAWWNAADGKYHAKFILTNDTAKEIAEQGYGVSCSFKVLNTGKGGTWHAVPYDEEITAGEFEHLALVSSPRYEDMRVLVNSKAGVREAKMNSNIKASVVIDRFRTESKGLVFRASVYYGDRFVDQTGDHGDGKAAMRAGVELLKRWYPTLKTEEIMEVGDKVCNAQDLGIMSDLQKDKYFQALSDTGLQLIIDGEYPEEIKKMAKMHQGDRAKKKAEEELATAGGTKKENKQEEVMKIKPEEATVDLNGKEVTVADIIKVNNDMAKENETLKAENAKAKEDLAAAVKKNEKEPEKDPEKKEEKCNSCGEPKHEGACNAEKKNAFEIAKKNAEEEEEKKKKEEEDKKKNAKDPEHFVKLNNARKAAGGDTTVMADTLHNKIDRGQSRYGSAKA